MNERLDLVNLQIPVQVAGTALCVIKLPYRATLVYASFGMAKVTGGPTTTTVTIKDAGAAIAILNAVSIGVAAGVVTEVKTKHVGGTNDPVDIPKGDIVSADLAFTGGASPTAEVDITLGLLMGAA